VVFAWVSNSLAAVVFFKRHNRFPIIAPESTEYDGGKGVRLFRRSDKPVFTATKPVYITEVVLEINHLAERACMQV